MTLQRLARELDETARQTSEMIDAITDAVTRLNTCAECGNATASAASAEIVRALQAQDRIEQRLRNMTEAVNRLAALAKFSDDTNFDEIWASLTLDELRLSELSGSAARGPSGDIEFF